MYTLGVREHVMIAHSFRGEVFGPAQRLHGATYVVAVELQREKLDADGLVIDIGLFSKWLRECLEPLAYRNLDELPEFKGINTTTEFLASFIYGRISSKLPGSIDGTLVVTLQESHVAWARFSAPVQR